MASPPPTRSDLVLDLDSIFVGRDFRAESFSQPRWWASGSCYTALVKSGSNGSGRATGTGISASGAAVSSSINGGGGGVAPPKSNRAEAEKSSSSAPTRDLVWHDVATNTTKTYVSSDLLVPPGHDAPLPVDDYALSSDKSRLLIFTNSRKVWRKKTRGDYWVLDITARDLRQLGGWNTKPSSLMFATFSPCGNKVAFVMGNNLYVQDVHTFKITALTSDGSNEIINGTFDWVWSLFQSGVEDALPSSTGGFAQSPQVNAINDKSSLNLTMSIHNSSGYAGGTAQIPQANKINNKSCPNLTTNIHHPSSYARGAAQIPQAK